MPDTSKVRRRAHAIVIAAIILIAAVPMGSAEAASPTATLVSGTVLPRDPPMDGIVRLDLLVRNDTSNAWSAGDPVHLSWKSGGKTMAEDVRPLGQPVPANGTVRVNLVTLAPAATGDFSLAVELETHGNRLPIGDPRIRQRIRIRPLSRDELKILPQRLVEPDAVLPGAAHPGADRERSGGLRQHPRLELAGVGLDRSLRVGRRGRQRALHRRIRHVREGERQVVPD